MGAWRQFKVCPPVQMGSQTKDVVDTRRALTRKEAGSKKTVKARSLVKGYQGPDLKDGSVDIAGCVGRGWVNVQLISGRVALAATFSPALHAKRVPRMLVAFGNWVPCV